MLSPSREQLHYSRTQAAASRVSLLCIAQQSLLDATLCIAHLLLCAAVRPLFAAFATVAFFKLVIFCIVEMRYIVVIFQSHDPQRLFNTNWNNMRRVVSSTVACAHHSSIHMYVTPP